MIARYNSGHSTNSSIGSRSLPPIAEHDPIPHHIILPRIPLRVPQKFAPPPYVRSTYPNPPQYKEYGSEGRRSYENKIERTWEEQTSKNWADRWADRQWFGSRKFRWAGFIGLGLMIMGIIFGLSVGLTVGLRNRNSTSRDQADAFSNTKFPAGSYSFETTLQRSSSACTSRATSWRCYPYTTGSNATFFWTISHHPSSSPQDHFLSYTVSSPENPFVPSFTNLTATLLDPGESEERLRFSFDMDKTVIPLEALSPTNRAARCNFRGTKFQATLWTRRSNSATVDPKKMDSAESFEAWPGDVEVLQTKESDLGSPDCEDVDGNAIADVQAAAGDCSCDYANFTFN